MGAWYTFRCPGCAYTAEVSGGPDCGFNVGTVTISCATCRTLRDVDYTNEVWKEPRDPLPEHPQCPSARTRTHRTKLWRHPGPCPKCRVTMEDQGGITIWD